MCDASCDVCDLGNWMNRRRQTSLVAALFTLFLIFILTNSYGYKIRTVISYGSRPLWDTPPGPRRIIPHYYAEGIDFNAHHCALHGWKLRDNVPEVWDAVLFNTELDLLEIRMHELDVVVDKFFIIESDRMSSCLRNVFSPINPMIPEIHSRVYQRHPYFPRIVIDSKLSRPKSFISCSKGVFQLMERRLLMSNVIIVMP